MSGEFEAVAAVSSAIAASCSVLVAWMGLRLQKTVQATLVKPEITFDGWKLENSDEEGRFTITTIKNIGFGPAKNIRVNIDHITADDYPGHMMPVFLVQEPTVILMHGESRECVSSGYIWWNQCQQIGSSKVVMFRLKAIYFDIYHNRYTTTYDITIENGNRLGGSNSLQTLCDGIYATGVFTKMESFAIVKIKSNLIKLKTICARCKPRYLWQWLCSSK